MGVENLNPGISIKMGGTMGGPQNDNIKLWTKAIIPTQAMGQVIDYSEMNFQVITNFIVVPLRATTDPMQVPNIALNSIAPNQATINITQGNPATVSVVGINVLSGGPIVAATNLNLITLYVRVEGY